MSRTSRLAEVATLASLAAGAWVSGACAGDATSARVTVSDSAGARIVTNLPGSVEAAEEWALSPAAEVEIGSGENPDVALFRVTAVVPLGGGRVAVATRSPAGVRIFETDGTLAATLGREGEGPGEFSQDVAAVVPLAVDSLAVWDRWRRRISVFTVDGRYVRETDLSSLVPLSPEAAPDSRGLAAWCELLPADAGALVLFCSGVFGPGSGVRRVAAPSYRISAEGEILGRFGPFPGESTFAGSGGALPVPFGAGTHAAGSHGRLVVGTAETPEYRVYGATGSLEGIVRWPDRDRALEGPMVTRWSEWLDTQLERRRAGERDAIRELLDEIPRPERFPAYGDVVAGDFGEIWVGEYPGQLGLIGLSEEVPRVPQRRWLVFRSDGALVATVLTPEGFHPHRVQEGRVWGVYRDEHDVESVRGYQLRSGP